jgi:hypothetical protein
VILQEKRADLQPKSKETWSRLPVKQGEATSRHLSPDPVRLVLRVAVVDAASIAVGVEDALAVLGVAATAALGGAARAALGVLGVAAEVVVGGAAGAVTVLGSAVGAALGVLGNATDKEPIAVAVAVEAALEEIGALAIAHSGDAARHLDLFSRKAHRTPP